MRDVLNEVDLGELIGDAELLVSELVTNALIHARNGDPLVEVTASATEALVRVHDDGPPVELEARDAGPTATSGRGLQIVETLADDWGTGPSGQGKVVWFSLVAPQES